MENWICKFIENRVWNKVPILKLFLGRSSWVSAGSSPDSGRQPRLTWPVAFGGWSAGQVVASCSIYSTKVFFDKTFQFGITVLLWAFKLEQAVVVGEVVAPAISMVMWNVGLDLGKSNISKLRLPWRTGCATELRCDVPRKFHSAEGNPFVQRSMP